MKRLLLLILVSTTFFAACQKEMDPSVLRSSSTTITGDSNLISKYIELDTLVSPSDTIRKILFFYDNQKRLSRLELSMYTNGIVVPADGYTTNYFYNGNDTLPFKETENSIDWQTGQSTTINRFYQFNNERLLRDSSVYPTYTEVNRYTFYANKIVDTILNYQSNNVINSKSLKIITYQKTDDLTISQRDTIVYSIDVPVARDTVTVTHAFSYDYNKNPLYVFHRIYPYYPTNEFQTIMGTEKNNVVESDQSFFARSAQGNFHWKYFYEYNVNGYPRIVRIFDVNDPTVVVKGLYFYTK